MSPDVCNLMIPLSGNTRGGPECKKQCLAARRAPLAAAWQLCGALPHAPCARHRVPAPCLAAAQRRRGARGAAPQRRTPVTLDTPCPLSATRLVLHGASARSRCTHLARQRPALRSRLAAARIPRSAVKPLAAVLVSAGAVATQKRAPAPVFGTALERCEARAAQRAARPRTHETWRAAMMDHALCMQMALGGANQHRT